MAALSTVAGKSDFVKLTATFYHGSSRKELSETLSTTSTVPGSKTSKHTLQMFFIKFMLHTQKVYRTLNISTAGFL